MKEIKPGQRKKLSALFAGYTWNYLPDAVLEGHFGRDYTDAELAPHTAVLEFPALGLKIFGGDPSIPAARRQLSQLPEPSFLLFVDREILAKEIHPGKLVLLPRFAFSTKNLDIHHLKLLQAQLPSGYHTVQMDLRLTHQIWTEKSDFTIDHMINFESPRILSNVDSGTASLPGMR